MNLSSPELRFISQGLACHYYIRSDCTGLPATIRAMTPQSVAHETLRGLQHNHDEIRVGLSKLAYVLGRFTPSVGFHLVNRQ